MTSRGNLRAIASRKESAVAGGRSLVAQDGFVSVVPEQAVGGGRAYINRASATEPTGAKREMH